jgi:hypothetical protein
MQTTTPTKPLTLKPKDEQTISAPGYYKWMTAEHIQRLVYPYAKDYYTATKRLTELACTYDYKADAFLDDGYISYGLLFELVARNKSPADAESSLPSFDMIEAVAIASSRELAFSSR